MASASIPSPPLPFQFIRLQQYNNVWRLLLLAHILLLPPPPLLAPAEKVRQQQLEKSAAAGSKVAASWPDGSRQQLEDVKAEGLLELLWQQAAWLLDALCGIVWSGKPRYLESRGWREPEK